MKLEKGTLHAAAARVFLATVLGISLTACGEVADTNVAASLPVESVSVTISTDSVVTSVAEIENMAESVTVTMSDTAIEHIDATDISEYATEDIEDEGLDVATETEVIDGASTIDEETEVITENTVAETTVDEVSDVTTIAEESIDWNKLIQINDFNANIQAIIQNEDKAVYLDCTDNNECLYSIKSINKEGNVETLQSNIFVHPSLIKVSSIDDVQLLSVGITSRVGCPCLSYALKGEIVKEVSVEGRIKTEFSFDETTDIYNTYNMLICMFSDDFEESPDSNYAYYCVNNDTSDITYLTFNSSSLIFENTGIAVYE